MVSSQGSVSKCMIVHLAAPCLWHKGRALCCCLRWVPAHTLRWTHLARPQRRSPHTCDPSFPLTFRSSQFTGFTWLMRRLAHLGLSLNPLCSSKEWSCRDCTLNGQSSQSMQAIAVQSQRVRRLRTHPGPVTSWYEAALGARPGPL